MHLPRLTFSAILLATLAFVWFTAQNLGGISQASLQKLFKGPVVKRIVPKSEASTFVKPDLIVMVRVTQSCNTEVMPDVDRERPEPLTILRTYFGSLELPVRINDQVPDDPAWSTGGFPFRPRTDSSEIAVGYRYILLLDAEVDFHTGTRYKIAHTQIGFRVHREKDGERVRPVKAGGELDVYSGRLLGDMLKEIQSSK